MARELIDRLGVIKALDEAKIKTTSEEYDRIIDVIGSMPTIEERKTGRWIYHIDDLFPAESTKECGRDWLLKTLPKRAAAERIRDWTGEVLVSGGSEVCG